MKVIIAGGRYQHLSKLDRAALDQLEITEVVSGGANGVDIDGEGYAKYRQLPVTTFLPDWEIYGKGAGPVRNKAMAEYADAVALFPGGRGTQSMWREAIEAGIIIHDFR